MAYTTIDKPTDYFSTNLWVADDSSPRSFTGFGHQPDFVWVKHRGSGSINHTLTDSVRGGDKMLFSNTTAVEDTKSHGEITSFNSDGITVADGTNSTYPRLYFNDLDPFGAGGGNYVGWSWKAGGTASSNSNGSITSSVSANTTAGFSIVSYTGTGSNATVGHGLGSNLDFLIVKRRSNTGEWIVFNSVEGSGKGLKLNTTGASFSADATVWNSTNPTSSVFSIGTAVDLNASGNTYIAYCFANKKGYSKFGSYTGNGSTDGTFVYTGFKPAWVMCKISSNGDSWVVYDNKRDTFNVTEQILRPNTSGTEGTESGAKMDLLSNGFKLRGSGGGLGQTNTSGETYIYMAFAENPFVTSTGIPTTAR